MCLDSVQKIKEVDRELCPQRDRDRNYCFAMGYCISKPQIPEIGQTYRKFDTQRSWVIL